MIFIKDFIKLLTFITRLARKYNSKLIYNLLFNYYIFIKVKALLKMQLKMTCVSNEIFLFLIMKHGKCSELYADENLYILCNYKAIDKSYKWFYLCSKKSKKQYKVAVIFNEDIEENNIYVSESMKFNINKYLGLEKQEHSLYFLIPVSNIISFTKEIKISLISNPYDCNGNVMNNLLQNFFSIPKYLRKDDIFCINVKKYAPEIKYCTADTKLQFLYFKVNNIKNENELYLKNEGFTVYGKTTLIQEANINSYIPKKCYCDISLNKNNLFLISWPPALNGLLQQIQSCINPFLQQDTCLDIKPVFLVEGPNGSGKTRLVKAAAETLGLHLLEADFAEIQSLTSAQTEAKLRIILNEAVNCVPCIIMFQNIQIFGMNAEGQKDDRVLSAFANEIKKIYSEKLKYPLVIIATSNDSDISVDTEKTFVEKIVMNHLKQEERYEILSWLIECKGLKHKADLHKIAKICSDFVLADFEALVLHAVKNHFKFLDPSQQNDVIELKNDDFVYACEYMQSIFSNEIGTPRVPKVYWEDIGGLADLKHEIMRRTEMSLLNISGIGRSGLLLYGPPGTGKTLLAKAVATECQIHFLSVKGPELLNMYVGQSEKNVRQVFERARAAAPCIIFFDELDSLAPNRGQSGDSGGVMDRVVSQLLAEMDGLESTNNVFIIGATNRPDLIDPALLRPGRFDKMLYVGIYSDMISQMCVLKALTRRFKMERNGQELDDLVIKLPKNLTGADFYSVCSNAWLRAVRRILTDDQVNKKKIKGENVIVTLDDFIHASKELVPSVSREEMLRYEKLKNDLSSK